MVIQSTVCVLHRLYPYGQLPVSQPGPCREEVSAEELVSPRWEQSPAALNWAEMDAEERASRCLWGTPIFRRGNRRPEQEAQPDRTWKARAAVTRDGHKRRERSCLLATPPTTRFLLYVSVAATKQDPWRKGDRGKERPCLKHTASQPALMRGL